MDETYEQVLLVKNEVFIFMIPPRTSNRAVRASDWKLDAPDWTGRLKLIVKGDKCFIRLEDKVTGQEYAKCPIDKYPGIAIEPVSDSSRYFVVRVQDDNGRAAFIGMGFADRGDSFDLNVALQDHFKLVEKQCKLEQEAMSDNQPKLDLKFKEGQTIKVNLNIKKSGISTSRPKPKGTGNISGNITGILPPPPGGLKLGYSSTGSKQDKPMTSSKSFDQESKISNTTNTTTSGDVKTSSTTTSTNNYFDELTDLRSLSISQPTTISHSDRPGNNSVTEAQSSQPDEWANFEEAFSNQESSLPTDSKPTNTQQSNWACF